MSIRVYKLTTGEEIVAGYKETNDEGILVSKPRILAFAPGADGQVNVQIVPYVIAAPDHDIRFKHPNVVFELDNVPKQLEDIYIQHTSGLVMPGA